MQGSHQRRPEQRGEDKLSSRREKLPLKPVYLIIGDDHPKVERALHRLRERMVEESGTDLLVDGFDARQHGGGDVIAAANTLAFLGGTRLVLVTSADSWPKAEKERVAAYIRSPSQDTCLVLVAETLPASDLLRHAVATSGDVLEYRAPRGSQIHVWLRKEAARLGLSLPLPESKHLVRRVGDDQLLLLREIEKLAAYEQGDLVTHDDIDRVVSRTAEASVFELLDHLAEGRGARVFAVVEDLLAGGEEPAVLFRRVMVHFQRLARVAALQSEGFARERIQAELKLKPYAVRKLQEQAARLGPEAVSSRVSVLAEADARMKGMGNLSDELELKLCLGRMLAAR